MSKRRNGFASSAGSGLKWCSHISSVLSYRNNKGNILRWNCGFGSLADYRLASFFIQPQMIMHRVLDSVHCPYVPYVLKIIIFIFICLHFFSFLKINKIFPHYDSLLGIIYLFFQFQHTKACPTGLYDETPSKAVAAATANSIPWSCNIMLTTITTNTTKYCIMLLSQIKVQSWLKAKMFCNPVQQDRWKHEISSCFAASRSFGRTGGFEVPLSLD